MPVSLRQQNKPLPSTHHSPHRAERHSTRTMAPADRLLVVAALFAAYQKKNDVDTYNLIQCGIEECFEGVKMYYRQQRAHPTPAVSSLAESFYHCLRAAQVCVTYHTVWDMQ
ncbi:hypothetical protein JZ751_012799 [Albula glossodonta]|uniref:Uncharacterized protein n=1 Tax=Albula glossodonta TaxID=121402 RepID=A0A8T2N6L2_9TELE|nr:hypothetical protein JZ751_012799 [Albula glossodonta]